MRTTLLAALIAVMIPGTLSAQCDRGTIVNNYNNVYLHTSVTTTELGWTGSAASCTPGIISDTAFNRSLRRINYFRELVGLPGNIVYDTSFSRQAQEAALMMAANGMLSHNPPVTWLCYTADGDNAAGKSNLSQGSHSSAAVSAYMNESGAANTAAGHRRWILYSRASKFGIGSTSNTSALWVIGPTVAAPPIDFIAYPSAGFFPAPLVPSSKRWSFGIPNANFSSAAVSMTDGSGAAVAVTLETLAANYGDNTIVWKPSVINTAGPYDEKYTVQVSNVLVGGSPQTYTYDVIICQPVHPPLCPAGLAWSDNDCACMPPASVSISGAVVSGWGEPVAGVSVGLAGAGSQTVVTTGDGLYSVEAQPGENYTLTPSKANDSIAGNGVTTLDILLLRKQILAMDTLDTPYKIIAADVNNSESITTLDIILIRSIVLQNAITFPNDRLWAFVPHDYVFPVSYNPFPFPSGRTYTNLSGTQADQNFIGIKLGDVNNSWDPGTPKQGAMGVVQFAMNEYNASPGSEITIPVKVKGFKAISGYQFTVTWDAAVLDLIEATNRTLNGYYGTQKTGLGYLTISWDNEMAKGVSLQDDEVVFELKFRVVGFDGAFSEIKIGSDLTASEAYNENLNLLEIVPVNGRVKVGDGSSIVNHPSSIINFIAQPNPFSNTTHIIFSLPEDETVSLIIYDLLGNKIKTVNAYYTAGEHQLEWNGTDENGNPLSKGLYPVRLVAGEYSDVLKVILSK